MEAMEISRSGLDVEWQRLQVIAANIANMNTTRTADGGAYVAQRLVSGPVEGFQALVQPNASQKGDAPDNGVMVYQIAASNSGTRQVYDPNHPHANDGGYITVPAISQAEEMSLMIKTQRSYEANLVALSAAQQMYSAALQVGRQS
ncbi:flagellar basal body rod protein FlgC [Parerythrobacter jejuensis]|uniref:Flagellar basal-body rod protein FlgC n=1 Tax=Parerythrobacter jejuensis TaxID=795812 RepID=A0A845APZ6_9SPHN|nr:flagellar basal body rod protein FlgC [Parerythrobacter jejuensis]MXP30566.1 flagellar basal body rod protein FlgC [Parerythrobacter jejuensis]MXP33326.1 flagellar basal body rod protein FlgC [Parerythrobacter jejuensis]